MYAEYAKDPRMKLNLGIRRRLAPLLDNGRDEIELMTAILFSLPGTPVLYYGDEIAMGDNVYLGDRDGVRTPMQWTRRPQRRLLARRLRAALLAAADGSRVRLPGGQRRGAAAHADLAAALDAPLHRACARSTRCSASAPTSRSQPSNPRIFAHIRRFEEDIVLCVHNLARSAQAVELDLSAYQGRYPVEMFGRSRFPRIGELPYLLTLQPRGFYWFALADDRRRSPMSEPVQVPTPSSRQWLDERRACATGCASSAGSPPSAGRWPASRSSRRAPCGEDPLLFAGARRGAVRDRHARALPAAAGAPSEHEDVRRRCDRADATNGRRTTRSPSPTACSSWSSGSTSGEAHRDGGGHGRLPPSRRHRRGHRATPSRQADRRRAVEQLGRVRRPARAEGVPPARAGDQPRARDAALPDRARVPEHRAAARAGTSTRARRSPPRSASPSSSSPAAATAGSWRSRRSRGEPERLPRAARRPRHGHRRRCTRCSRPTRRSGVRARGAEPASRSALLTATIDEQHRAGLRATCPTTSGVAPIAGRGEEVRDRLAPRSQIGGRRHARSASTATTTSARRCTRRTAG